MEASLLTFYRTRYPQETSTVVPRHSPMVAANGSTTFYLKGRIDYHSYVILNGRRIVPSQDIYSAPNALIQTVYGEGSLRRTYVGQVQTIFTHEQTISPSRLERTTLFDVKWLKPLRNHAEYFCTDRWDIQLVDRCLTFDILGLTDPSFSAKNSKLAFTNSTNFLTVTILGLPL
jgi:hypothetical protein